MVSRPGLISCLALVGCSAPIVGDDTRCDGPLVNYVVLVDESPGLPGSVLDAVSVTDSDGAVHWATHVVEWGGDATSLGEDGDGYVGEPDADCDGGYFAIGSTEGPGYVIVGFDFTRDEPRTRGSAVDVHAVRGCETTASYQVVVMSSDQDAGYGELGAAEGSSSLALPTGCDERGPDEPVGLRTGW